MSALPVADAFIIGQPVSMTIVPAMIILDNVTPSNSAAARTSYAASIHSSVPAIAYSSNGVRFDSPSPSTLSRDIQVKGNGNDMIIDRDMFLPEEVYNHEDSIIRYNLPLNIVMTKESICPLPKYQFQVPLGLSQLNVTLDDWKYYTRRLIDIAKLREYRGRNRYARWNQAMVAWQRAFNEEYLIPRGMYCKIISHQDGYYDMRYNVAGGRHWLAISLIHPQSMILSHEDAMTGIGREAFQGSYCCHPYFGHEEIPVKLRGFLYKVLYSRRVARQHRDHRHHHMLR